VHVCVEDAVRLFIGDARDTALLDQAIAGQDFVVDAIGTRRPFVATALETDVAHALLAAIGRHDVSRIAAISSLGVGTSISHVNWFFRALIPLFFRGVMPDKEGMEAAFRASGPAWLIVRPSGLTDRPPTGNVRVLAPSSFEKGFQIARADVAAYILDALESDDPLRRIDDITTT
jgi:uncharacterized protein YbjT (DUF2867 family)